MLVGLLGRSGVGSCPNLPQRRSGPGWVAEETAEYQRFFSRAPTRSGPLWQIWTRTGFGPGPDRVRTGFDWSHATRAPHLSQVPLLAAPPGAEHGAPGGSFRGAPDCEAVRTAQSCGNRRTHPGRGPERSSQGARIGSGPWAPLAPDPAAERPCNRFGHTPPHKPHTPHSNTPRITFPE